jgi:hypothetical protein
MEPATAIAVRQCCALRQDLANQFAIAARLYYEAVVLLSQTASSMDFERLRAAARAAQERAATAGSAFEEHVNRHGC